MNRRILFVAMQNSVHVARWVKKIVDTGWDLHVFPVNNEPPHEDLAGVTIHWPKRPLHPRQWVRKMARAIFPGATPAIDPAHAERSRAERGLCHKYITPWPTVVIPAGARRLVGLARRVDASPPGHDAFPTRHLDQLIRRLRPDLIHSMEFQHASYGVLKTRRTFNRAFPPWLATNWGSDIYLFRHYDEHRPVIQELLRTIDFYSCECERDIGLARELGLTAPALPVLPNSGGFDLDELRGLRFDRPPSRRRLIMVKGYQHFAGRAMRALDAVERCRDLLDRYEILVFSAGYDVRDRVEAMAKNGWAIRAPGYVLHKDMLRAFGRARLYLGVNISDAISTSLLESMAMGAFPIQTNTSCCDEWIEDGKSGFSIPPDDLDVITDRLRRALTDDELVDRAAIINEQTVRTRLDERILRDKVLDFYDRIFDATGARPLPS